MPSCEPRSYIASNILSSLAEIKTYPVLICSGGGAVLQHPLQTRPGQIDQLDAAGGSGGTHTGDDASTGGGNLASSCPDSAW